MGLNKKRIKYIAFTIAVLIVASGIGFAVVEERPQLIDDHAKVEEKPHFLPGDIIIEGTDRVTNISELHKNKVIKTGKFKQPGEKSKGSYSSDLTEYLKANKLLDEVGPDTSVGVSCENGECTYEVVKLGNITMVRR